MHIDRIVMHNFKSFAGRTSIPFPTGFTVICGPNGSGKSNIVDAFIFVLGTSSARTIRAKKLHNLIFNGGKNRKPAEFCEVSLYLKDKEKEIKITRKINKSGVSIYKIDGKTVTRSKIIETLTNANLSPDGYNIIAQGDVTRIIEMSPLERRSIIDDISGISEFDEKKQKSQQELEKVETRIREGMLVISEKQRLIERLKKEKENAEKFIKLEKRHKTLRASITKKRIEEVENSIGMIEAKIDEQEKVLKDVEKKFEGEEKTLERFEKELEKVNKEIIEKSSTYETIKEIDAIRTEIIRKKDKIEMNLKEVERLEELVSRIKYLSGREDIAVKEVLRLDDQRIFGTIGSLISVPQTYSVAIKTALGHHINDIIVLDENTAIKYIRFLKKKRIGTARFIPLKEIQYKEERRYEKGGNIHGYAIDLISFDEKFRKAIGYTLSNTLIVKSIEDVKGLKGRIVTLEGDLKESAGALVGGFHKKLKQEKGRNYEKEIEKLKSEIPKLEKEIESLENKLEELEKSREKESEKVKDLEKKKENIEKGIENIRKNRKEIYEKRLAIQSEINRMKIEKAKLDAKLENLRLEMDQFKDIEEFFDMNIEKMEEEAKKCIIEINNLGPINMKAIEEFETMNVEFIELKGRLDRLLEEKYAIQNVIDDIEKRRYTKFMETMMEISEQLNKVYHELTEGEARLELEEKNNIDSGLVIEATPKGKKFVSLDAMSGGEKTLTSLAFLFAIQQRYGSPFYILDEIDAALDKPNTRKVVNLIKKYSKETQFIIISHNDTTMTEADTLFGVAMENGVSRVFGIRMPSAQISVAVSKIR